MKLFGSLILLYMLCGSSLAQSGGSYAITQSVISNGGGTSDGGPYSVSGTTAQSVAGTDSSAFPYSVHGGFWQGFLAPTAANASVSGIVRTADGMPIGNVQLQLSDGVGTTRTARTNPFGYFRFENVEAGNTYILSAAHKQFEFATRVVSVVDDVVDLIVTPVGFK